MEADGECPQHLERLSRALAYALRHDRATAPFMRSDGFIQLSEVLRSSNVQKALEALTVDAIQIEPGSNTVPAAIADVVLEVVEKSFSKERPRFELWSDDGFWIRATHKHSIGHVVPLEDDPSAAAGPAAEESTYYDGSQSSCSTATYRRNQDGKDARGNYRSNGYNAAHAGGRQTHATPDERAPAGTFQASKPASMRGQVRYFNPEKGFGFIAAEGYPDDIFLHVKQIIGPLPGRFLGTAGTKPTGPEMEFDIEFKMGDARAANARIVEQNVKDINGEDRSRSANQGSKIDLSLLLEMLPGDATDTVRNYLTNWVHKTVQGVK